MKNLDTLVSELLRYPNETGWIEFKHNNSDPQEIGEYISALSNSATYHDKDYAYMLWGIENDTHRIIGTTFDYRSARVGQEELESWLRRLLTANTNFRFESIDVDNNAVTLLIISKAVFNTVKFKNIEYIRVGSYKKPLKDFPAMEAQLWNKINRLKFIDSSLKNFLPCKICGIAMC